MGGDEAFAQLQVLFPVIGHALGQLACMRQKEVEVEGAGLGQHLRRRKQGGAFLAIGSSLISFPQIKQEFGRSAGLSHLVLLLLETCVLASRVHEPIPLCQAFFNLEVGVIFLRRADQLLTILGAVASSQKNDAHPRKEYSALICMLFDLNQQRFVSNNCVRIVLTLGSFSLIRRLPGDAFLPVP
jgi:hypothetical protein